MLKTYIGMMGFVLLSSKALAGTETIIVATDRGWYNAQGMADDSPPNVKTPNYAAGTHQDNVHIRNWFMFDLSGLDGVITSMSLNAAVPQGLSQFPIETGGYRSPDPFETYELYSVEMSPNILMGGNGGKPAYIDLGTGSFYGSMTMTESQEGQIISIPLLPRRQTPRIISVSSGASAVWLPPYL